MAVIPAQDFRLFGKLPRALTPSIMGYLESTGPETEGDSVIGRTAEVCRAWRDSPEIVKVRRKFLEGRCAQILKDFPVQLTLLFERCNVPIHRLPTRFIDQAQVEEREDLNEPIMRVTRRDRPPGIVLNLERRHPRWMERKCGGTIIQSGVSYPPLCSWEIYPTFGKIEVITGGELGIGIQSIQLFLARGRGPDFHYFHLANTVGSINKLGRLLRGEDPYCRLAPVSPLNRRTFPRFILITALATALIACLAHSYFYE